MKDRIVEHPNRYMLVPVDGSNSLVDLIPAPGEIAEEGTELNKATLLSDNTASKLKLTGADPTVNDALASIGTALDGSIRIASGSYVGTGTYGASHPNSLTFDFEPDVLFVFKNSYVPTIALLSGGTTFSDSFICFLRGGSAVKVSYHHTVVGGGTSTDVTDMPYSMNGNTVSWHLDKTYANYGPLYQMNDSGATYHYIAIGRGSSL